MITYAISISGILTNKDNTMPANIHRNWALEISASKPSGPKFSSSPGFGDDGLVNFGTWSAPSPTASAEMISFSSVADTPVWLLDWSSGVRSESCLPVIRIRSRAGNPILELIHEYAR